MGVWNWLFDPSGLTPHGFCLTWEPGLIGLHAGSDALIAVSYLSIPLAMASFARQRADLHYRWVVYCFVGFILACATTHILAVLTLWIPLYGIEGVVKAVTAGLSVTTAGLLWPLIPRLVALPSPAQLVRVNAELSTSLAGQERIASALRESEARGRAANADLERRVAERTSDLSTTNRQLTEALAERARALQALERSEAEFRATFEGASVGQVLAEPNTRRILRANQAFARMMGTSCDDLVGRQASEIIDPRDEAGDRDEFRRLMTGETETFVREQRYLRRDGTAFWARVSANLVRVPYAEHPQVTVAAIEDIDARRRAEAELLAANRRLEQAVSERTAALSQRDVLLREVYHRVRNNLQIVDSLLAMVDRALPDQEGKLALRGLRVRIHVLGLVHHQLMKSADLRTFDIAPFLQDLSQHILESQTHAGIELRVDACSLDVDLDFAIPLGLVVTELVSEAIRYAVPGGGRINVRLNSTEGESIVLSVSDDGVGARTENGSLSLTGVGQRIVRRLVTQLEGTMIVRHGAVTTTEISLARPAGP